MYYLKIMDNDANSLIYYCRNCGNENDTLTAENVCVSDTQIKRKEDQYIHIVNEYTKFDPTLPRINTIDCPNSKCASNAGASEAGASEAGASASGAGASTGTGASEAVIKVEREVIYIRYDDTNMKYMYVCAICNTQWKNDK
jgi:DNA-directed RNA polymerase subunit M/transcription elongation factor TFIIS